MTSFTDPQLRDQERQFVETEKATYPHLFEPPQISNPELRQRLGILTPIPGLTSGYVKYSPLDFIVEEILPNGSAIDVSTISDTPSLTGSGSFIHADLIKLGISTLDAVEHLASSLGLSIEQISYAGIKDSHALTSQRVSFPASVHQQLINFSSPNFFLQNLTYSSGPVKIGDLMGNRFTLFVRTPLQVGQDQLDSQLSSISQTGVLNFYGHQRFGEPRYLSHVFGQLILSGRFEELVKTYLFKTSPFEIPYLTWLRQTAASYYPNWSQIADLFSRFPWTLRTELTMLNSLSNNPSSNAFIEALDSVSRQIKIWTFSYSSYLANLYLSQLAHSTQAKIPLLLSTDRHYQDPYRHWLIEHGTMNFHNNLKPFPYLYPKKNFDMQVRLHAKFHYVSTTPDGVALNFDLPKAAYATTLLMFLFDVHSGRPLPSWVKDTQLDSKALLGTGDLTSIKTKFNSVIDQLLAFRSLADDAT